MFALFVYLLLASLTSCFWFWFANKFFRDEYTELEEMAAASICAGCFWFVTIPLGLALSPMYVLYRKFKNEEE